jgi:small subunit ribosomal protein S16
MVKLRLRRKGRIHHPVYDIVAVDSRARRDGAYLERLGYYDPNTAPSTISIDAERAVYWLGVGAQPTEVVKFLLSYEGVLLRKALTHKGLPKEEIDTLVAKHKDVVRARYNRRRDLRKKRKIAKATAAAAPKEEAPAPAAEATESAE